MGAAPGVGAGAVVDVDMLADRFAKYRVDIGVGVRRRGIWYVRSAPAAPLIAASNAMLESSNWSDSSDSQRVDLQCSLILWMIDFEQT